MMPLTLPATGRKPLRVLCIGAHSDDIEIGCAGTLLQLQEQRRLRVDWVVLSGNPERRAETTRARKALLKPASCGDLIFGDFPDTCFPACYTDLKLFMADLRLRATPDLIFCHERLDAHQDHRVVNELVWGAFRDHTILEYEIPKWDGGLTTPSVYVPLSAGIARRKVRVLMKHFGSQRPREWFRADTFEALMRLRGMECRAASGLAEGFHAHKLALAAV